MRVLCERRRDTAVQRMTADKLQRAEIRQLDAADLALNNALHVPPHRVHGDALDKDRIVLRTIRYDRKDRRVALVASPAMREVIQFRHGPRIRV